MLSHFSDVGAPAGEHAFQLNIDFPKTAPAPRPMPWDLIDFRTDPEAYLRAVFQSILSDKALVDADFDVAGSKAWFHAPWLAREPIRGMTAERRSDAGELAVGQPGGIQNWAVSFYNDFGGYTLGRVWANPAAPGGSAARFPVGTVGFKLLFTEAPPTQVSYLQGSKIWRAKIDPNAGAKDMRLLQIDVAVRDARANGTTGWVFGTLMYFNQDPNVTQFAWENVIPVTVTWGADPALLRFNFARGEVPKESWVNPQVASFFATVRTPAHGFASPHLGLFGRANGPVDNPLSSCLACHGRAIDLGVSRPREHWNAVLPFAPNAQDRDFVLQWFFRNLKPEEPFLHGTTSLDYSLQLQVGIRRFRDWLFDQTPPSPAMAPAADAAPPAFAPAAGEKRFIDGFVFERGDTR